MGKRCQHTAGLRAKLLKGGLGILFLLGLLSFGTGIYFWGKIDWAIEDLEKEIHTLIELLPHEDEAQLRTLQDRLVMAVRASESARQNFLAVISIIWIVSLGGGVGILATAFNRMASDLSRAQEALRESESHSRLIIETAHEAFVAIDVDGVIIDWNRQAENLFGWSREEVIGQRFEDTIMTPQGHHAEIEGYQRFLSTGEGMVLDQRLEVMAKHRQGRQFPVELTIWPIQVGQTYRFNAFIHDISERKHMEHMRSDFVSFVTHQLRTPLAGIKWLLELASEAEALPEEPRSYIQDARESADRLIKLVNDLLDISRLERGKFSILPEAVNLGELTHSVLAEVSPLVQQKGHQLRCTLPHEIPAIVVDRQLMRQVMLNLVSNAIKYTAPGGEISVQLCRAGASVQWSIADSGIGIPKAAQARLFEKFYRAENGLTVETEGTGLGLYLVRLILGQFGGRVWCESAEGKGATFLFTLPLAE
jgi:PAS domain S-box-containing protein